MAISNEQLVIDLRGFITPSYPDIDIRVAPWDGDPARLAIYFTELQFAEIYPYQRWHYLTHLIPAEYQEQHLETSVWFELAPGESSEDLSYPDEELIESITPPVMKCLKGARFFEQLDNVLCPLAPSVERAPCHGDYRHSRPILLQRGFKDEEFFDVFHVLMMQGGFCDCEILYNVADESRLKEEYWKARAAGGTPYDPHARN